MIEIKNVTFHYSGLDQAGLSDFNLSVTDGECILCAVHQAVVKQL